ncbi:hypothetical protein H2203_006011 [Taxawa tesnikishii (nom. ined.)]|nr:hypothetical protein H2203_006011 [Dothideales sp. JES 119]
MVGYCLLLRVGRHRQQQAERVYRFELQRYHNAATKDKSEMAFVGSAHKKYCEAQKSGTPAPHAHAIRFNLILCVGVQRGILRRVDTETRPVKGSPRAASERNTIPSLRLIESVADVVVKKEGVQE